MRSELRKFKFCYCMNMLCLIVYFSAIIFMFITVELNNSTWPIFIITLLYIMYGFWFIPNMIDQAKIIKSIINYTKR